MFAHGWSDRKVIKMPLILLMGPFPYPRQAVEGVAPVAGTQLPVLQPVLVSEQPSAVHSHPGSTGCVQLCAELYFGAVNTSEGLGRRSRSGHSLLPTALVADGTSIVDAASGQVAVTGSFNLTHLCLIHLPLSN